MLVYLDSSVLVRAYLADEDGHEQAGALLEDDAVGRVTSSLTRIEVSGALVNAGRAGRVEADDLIELLDADLDAAGRVSVVAPPSDDIEARALEIVRAHGLRTLDAWHLAVAIVAASSYVESDEKFAFASRDADQAAAAEALGLAVLP